MQAKAKRVKSCKQCGTDFEYEGWGNVQYCSAECRQRAKYISTLISRNNQANKAKTKEWTYEGMLAERERNRSYAERQKQKTMEMYGRITIPSEVKADG